MAPGIVYRVNNKANAAMSPLILFIKTHPLSLRSQGDDLAFVFRPWPVATHQSYLPGSNLRCSRFRCSIASLDDGSSASAAL